MNNKTASWRTIGDKKIYARSIWEANFGRWLQWQKEHGYIADWKHEPKTFWFIGIKRGCVSYKPDYVTYSGEGKETWYEVKGWMDPKSKTKIKRFKKYFPSETLIVIDSKWFKANNAVARLIIPSWESGKKPRFGKRSPL